MVEEIVFLLVHNVPTSANWPAGKGPQIGGRGWMGLGLGAGRSKRNNKQFAINLW